MSIETTRHFLLDCTLINFGIILAWFLMSTVLRRPLYRLWGHWFRLTPEQFDAFNLYGITFYKSVVLIFNAVPCIALYLL